ncbi:MAG: F0F1 ATP synthase subunit B [Candidatus Daviesbacteria bacterium]|nr:F0F1 ATP synthase subunit B [Candidatus Daviesbacteria bacterium]
MNFLNDFGVQPVLLAAQIVNFVILLYLLKRFLYKPVLKVLDERKKVIADSLKKADEIEARLVKIEEDREKELSKAAVEARSILEDATKAATQITLDGQLKATEEANRIIAEGQRIIISEKEKLQQEIRSELATLVTLGLQKVTGKVLTEKDKKALIETSIKELK